MTTTFFRQSDTVMFPVGSLAAGINLHQANDDPCPVPVSPGAINSRRANTTPPTIDTLLGVTNFRQPVTEPIPMPSTAAGTNLHQAINPPDSVVSAPGAINVRQLTHGSPPNPQIAAGLISPWRSNAGVRKQAIESLSARGHQPSTKETCNA